jgi:hypothetical protein
MNQTWQRDCEQAADHHIGSHLEHDRRQLARRLHDDALGMRCPGPTGQQADPIRRCLADVMISGTQYLAQLMTSSVAQAEDLADDLLRLHHQLRPSDVWQLRVEQIAREHGPAVRRSLTVDEVRQAILRYMAAEQPPAYRSRIRVLLYRLAEHVEEWRTWAPTDEDQHGAVHDVAQDLVAVLEELQPEQLPGDAT